MLRYIFKLKKQALFFYQRKPFYLPLKQISTKTEPFKETDLVSWTNTISALAQGGLNTDVALLNACQMMNSGSKPNDHAVVHLVRTCTNYGWFSLGQQLHCQIIGAGHDSNVFVSTTLINFYVKFELINEAQNLFDEIPEPSLVSWNSLISGYVHSGQFRKALNSFLELESSDLSSDSYSCTAALSACGQLSLLQFGKSIHSKIVKLGAGCSIIVGNCLTDMYGKCGAVEESVKVFGEMIDRDTISWNSVIAAYARNGRLEEALSFLHQMTDPDTISYNEVISGIAQFGKIEDAIYVLFSMPNPTSSSWNSIITSYVNHSRARDALEFFSKMYSSGIQMDQFTYSSILSGIASLSAITWGILIHCCTLKSGLGRLVVVGSALVDMYSKCGKITEAEVVFHSIQKKNLITWNAMISGYAHNGDSNKVVHLFEQLILVKNLQPDGITFLNVLSACWHNRMPLEAANRYFELMMNEYRIDATAEHCSSMIRIMGQEGKVHRAEKMIYQLGFELSGAVWRALLAACVICGNVVVAKVAAEKVMQLEGNSEYVCKNRYLVMEVFLDPNKDLVADEPIIITQFNLSKAIKDSIHTNFGECGLALSLNSFQVKYVNPISKLCIIRASREEHQKVWAAITMVRSIGSCPVTFNLLDISGSISACKKAALKCEELKFEQYKLMVRVQTTDDVLQQMQNCLEKIKVLEH